MYCQCRGREKNLWFVFPIGKTIFNSINTSIKYKKNIYLQKLYTRNKTLYQQKRNRMNYLLYLYITSCFAPSLEMMKNDVSHADKLLKPIFCGFPEKKDAGFGKSKIRKVFSTTIFG